jgi:ubiquinone/menaquinone biosynthesis C-methylase UbiE
MAISDKAIKDEITKRWDYSSQRYDSYHGHGIKSAEEMAAWTDFFRQVISGEQLSILDIGCGTGEISLVLARMGHKVTGIDLSEKMLDRAKTKAKMMEDNQSDFTAEFLIGDAENLPFEPYSFDAVVTRHVLWTLPNPQKAVNNWAGVLKKGGKL